MSGALPPAPYIKEDVRYAGITLTILAGGGNVQGTDGHSKLVLGGK